MFFTFLKINKHKQHARHIGKKADSSNEIICVYMQTVDEMGDDSYDIHYRNKGQSELLQVFFFFVSLQDFFYFVLLCCYCISH